MARQANYINALAEGYALRAYTIEGHLGEGSFGITYLARHTHFDEQVAIKEYYPYELCFREENGDVAPRGDTYVEDYKWGLDSFLKEAKILRRFSETNIAQVRDYFEENGAAYIIMEYEKGQTFKEWLKSFDYPKNPPGEKQLLEIVLPLLDALSVLHKGDYLHRDIKPANIYLPENSLPILIDFGAAREALSDKTQNVTKIYTAGYAPKEQYSSSAKLGAWTDIYALSANLYYAISGQQPLESTDRGEARDDDLPDPLKPAIEIGRGLFSDGFLRGIDKGLAYLPKDRPQSAEEFKKILTQKTASAVTKDKDKDETVYSSRSKILKSSKKTPEANYLKGNNFYQQGDYKSAFIWYQKSANQGNVEAQRTLGRMLKEGLGIPKNNTESVKWFYKAYKQGDARAQNSLGLMCEKGLGVKKSYKNAFLSYQKSAKQNNANAQFNLGRMYEKGYAVTLDYKTACEWYEKSAKQGDANAQFSLGRLYKNARGVPQNYKLAFQWYEKSAKQGHTNAQTALAELYLEGSGVVKNYKLAIKWYEQSANQGNTLAQIGLGWMYEEGLGVAKNAEKFIFWYTKAANQGDKFAQNSLGYAYENATGVKKDMKKALLWYKKAAKQGDKKAIAKVKELI